MNNFMSDGPGFYEDIRAGGGLSMSSAAASNPIGGGDEDSDGRLLLRTGGSSAAAVEREHMFDKVVTPSDVGKLNRLVIPKQNAEKYFPLDSSTNEKGLSLNFEDRNGKPWRFRYSYWNSSQSYVMTKGWSRFVKEKKLDAGDIVSFQRGVGETGKDRLFIDWRRRPDAPDLLPLPPNPRHYSSFRYRSGTTAPWNPLSLNHPHPIDYSPYFHNHYHLNHNNNPPYGINFGGYNSNNTVVNGNPCPPGSLFYFRPSNTTAVQGGGIIVAGRPQHEGYDGGVGGREQMVYQSVPVVQGKAVAAKRLRLFGVNMDCPISISEEDNACEMPLPHYFPSAASSPTSSSSNLHPNISLHFMRRPNNDEERGKGSMSLDLDI